MPYADANFPTLDATMPEGELLGAAFLCFLRDLGEHVSAPEEMLHHLSMAVSYTNYTIPWQPGEPGEVPPAWVSSNLVLYCLDCPSGEPRGIQQALFACMGVACGIWPSLGEDNPWLPETLRPLYPTPPSGSEPGSAASSTREAIAHDLVCNLASPVRARSYFSDALEQARLAAGLGPHDLVLETSTGADPHPPEWIAVTLAHFMVRPDPWHPLPIQTALAHLFQHAIRTWSDLETSAGIPEALRRAYEVVDPLPVEHAVRRAREHTRAPKGRTKAHKAIASLPRHQRRAAAHLLDTIHNKPPRGPAEPGTHTTDEPTVGPEATAAPATP
jgi:hypothetical protein